MVIHYSWDRSESRLPDEERGTGIVDALRLVGCRVEVGPAGPAGRERNYRSYSVELKRS